MRRTALLAGLWWLAGLVVLLAGATWIGSVGPGVPAFDSQGLMLANAWRSPGLDLAFRGLTWLGSLLVLLPLMLATAAVLRRRGHRREAWFVIAAPVGAAILTQLAKQLALRPRPELFPALVSVASPFSFPSAHAMQVTAVAVGLLLAIVPLAPRCRPWAIPVLLAVVVLVGLSRLYLQVHYPSDVLAGTLAAACWTVGLHAFMRPGGTESVA
ncbi:MAG: phosphatase PAP2 family protein [Sulfuritalea sp.]|nr:phosphatase PAP2 family protein [Sulfuritalea sp.]MDP1984417.1 phosphatase PAP2 family protein [Sulfuritalea sp.]